MPVSLLDFLAGRSNGDEAVEHYVYLARNHQDAQSRAALSNFASGILNISGTMERVALRRIGAVGSFILQCTTRTTRSELLKLFVQGVRNNYLEVHLKDAVPSTGELFEIRQELDQLLS